MGFSKEIFFKVFLQMSFIFQNIYISFFFKEGFFFKEFFFQLFYKEDFFTRCSYFFPTVFQKEIKQSWEIKETVKKSDCKRDDDANREKQKLRNTSKRARVAEAKVINEDIRTYLHDNVDEMEIENRVQEEQMEVEVEEVNSDLHVNVDEVNIEDQNQDPETGLGMYISCIFEIRFL